MFCISIFDVRAAQRILDNTFLYNLLKQFVLLFFIDFLSDKQVYSNCFCNQHCAFLFNTLSGLIAASTETVLFPLMTWLMRKSNTSISPANWADFIFKSEDWIYRMSGKIWYWSHGTISLHGECKKNSVLIYQIHVEKSSVEQSLPVLTNILVLGLHTTLQPAETKLTAEDLGRVLRPPDDPVSIGSKKSAAWLNVFSKLKAQAFTMLDKNTASVFFQAGVIPGDAAWYMIQGALEIRDTCLWQADRCERVWCCHCRRSSPVTSGSGYVKDSPSTPCIKAGSV